MPDRRRVLVVDDDTEIVRAITTRLGIAGYQVLHAANGREGIEAAAADNPDVIVLDIRMPIMNGMELLDQLRRRPETKHVPVIVLSASIVQKNRAFDLGARYFLEKPYDAKTLLATIQAVLEERKLTNHQPAPTSHSAQP